MSYLSKCHNAPTVVIKGNLWDVDPESMTRGSTYGYGCTECHKACDVASSESETPPNTDPLEAIDEILNNYGSFIANKTNPENNGDFDENLTFAEAKASLLQMLDLARLEEVDKIPEYGLEKPTDYACYDLNHSFNKCVVCYKQMRHAELNPKEKES